ncbi:hypothetical protein BDW22DRAFT_1343511 [Trametopsis cervina]|nr:hypothetical protein BDW22DRAFT_1343511 [Trametopsis cervina]
MSLSRTWTHSRRRTVNSVEYMLVRWYVGRVVNEGGRGRGRLAGESAVWQGGRAVRWDLHTNVRAVGDEYIRATANEDAAGSRTTTTRAGAKDAARRGAQSPRIVCAIRHEVDGGESWGDGAGARGNEQVSARAPQYGDARALVNDIDREEAARARGNDKLYARAQYADAGGRTQGAGDEGGLASSIDKLHAMAQYADMRARAQGGGVSAMAGGGGEGGCKERCGTHNGVRRARAQEGEVAVRVNEVDGGEDGCEAGRGGADEGVEARGVRQRRRVVGQWLRKRGKGLRADDDADGAGVEAEGARRGRGGRTRTSSDACEGREERAARAAMRRGARGEGGEGGEGEAREGGETRQGARGDDDEGGEGGEGGEGEQRRVCVRQKTARDEARGARRGRRDEAGGARRRQRGRGRRGRAATRETTTRARAARASSDACAYGRRRRAMRRGARGEGGEGGRGRAAARDEAGGARRRRRGRRGRRGRTRNEGDEGEQGLKEEATTPDTDLTRDDGQTTVQPDYYITDVGRVEDRQAKLARDDGGRGERGSGAGYREREMM